MTVLDLRLFPVAVALWIGAVVGLHTALTPSFRILLVVAIAGAGAAARRRHTMTTWVVALIVGAGIAGMRVDAASPSAVQNFVDDAGIVRFDAVLNAEPRLVEDRGFGGLEVEQSLRAPVTIIRLSSQQETWTVAIPATMEWKPGREPVQVGEELRGLALLHPDDPAARSAYRISVRGALQRVRAASRGSTLATHVREGLARATGAEGGGAGAALLPGLVLGDTRAQSPELIDDLRVSGLTHLTAVSGANLAIVIAAVMWGLRRSRIPARHRHVIVVLTILAFVAVVQPQPSVVRAAMMGGISVFAMASGERRASASVLWLTVALLLIIDPFLAWQYGFALSVAATAGLIVLRPLILTFLPGGHLGDAFLVTVSAQVATLPILLLMGRPPTWVSIPANMLCEPLVAPATVIGFVAALLAASALLPVPFLSQVLMALAGAVAVPGVWLAEFIARLAHTGAASPLATTPIRSLGQLGLVVMVVLVLWRLGLHRRWFAVMVVVYLFACACAPQALHRWPQADWWYAVCDVGQGDSSVFSLGAGQAMVVDFGPDARLERTCLRQLGVRHVTAAFITHFHADHVEGAAGLVGQADVSVVYSTPLREPEVEWRRTVAALRRAPQPLQAGDSLRFGSTVVQVLWPVPERVDGSPNSGSLVLDVSRAGVHVLVTGDADAPAQAEIQLPSEFAILKVPHHGSRFQDRSFLERVHAPVAVISVGKGNDYGHPASSTVAALRAQGVRVLRTDVQGALAFAVRRGRLAYSTLSH